VAILAHAIMRTPATGEAQEPVPGLGQHMEVVLGQWLHLSKDEIARLQEEGVV